MGPLVKRLKICTVAELVTITTLLEGGSALIRKNGSLPWLRNKAMLSGELPIATRSGLPSRSKSAAATANELEAAGRSMRGVKELSVRLPGLLVFQNTERTIEFVLAQIRSSFPSPSRSATVRPRGAPGQTRFTGGANDPALRTP